MIEQKNHRHKLNEFLSTRQVDRRYYLKILKETRIWLRNRSLGIFIFLTLTVNVDDFCLHSFSAGKKIDCNSDNIKRREMI